MREVENPLVLEIERPRHGAFMEECPTDGLILSKADIERRRLIFGDEDEE